MRWVTAIGLTGPGSSSDWKLMLPFSGRTAVFLAGNMQLSTTTNSVLLQDVGVSPRTVLRRLSMYVCQLWLTQLAPHSKSLPLPYAVSPCFGLLETQGYPAHSLRRLRAMYKPGSCPVHYFRLLFIIFRLSTPSHLLLCSAARLCGWPAAVTGPSRHCLGLVRKKTGSLLQSHRAKSSLSHQSHRK